MDKFRVWDIEGQRHRYDCFLEAGGSLYFNDVGRFGSLEQHKFRIQICFDIKDKDGSVIYEGDVLEVKFKAFEGNVNYHAFYEVQRDRFNGIKLQIVKIVEPEFTAHFLTFDSKTLDVDYVNQQYDRLAIPERWERVDTLRPRNSQRNSYSNDIAIVRDFKDQEQAEAIVFPADPVAKNLGEIVSAKQLGMIRALAREAKLDWDKECNDVMKCRSDELSKTAASAFIKHLQQKSKIPG